MSAAFDERTTLVCRILLELGADRRPVERRRARHLYRGRLADTLRHPWAVYGDNEERRTWIGRDFQNHLKRLREAGIVEYTTDVVRIVNAGHTQRRAAA